MSVTYTGEIGYDAFGEIWAVAISLPGTMLVDGGSTYTHGSSTVPGSNFIQIGRDAGAVGSITVTGAGSTFTLLGSGTDDAGFHVGRIGTGLFEITAGGALVMTDLPNVANSYIGFNIARDAGSNGTMNVDAGSIDIAGWGSYANVGRGGTGVLNLTNGATFETNVTQSSGIQIGNNVGANGTINVGAGTGISLHSGTATPIDPAYSAGTSINVGVNGGVGALNIAGTVALSSTVGNTGVVVGRDALGGGGTLTMTTGSSLSISTTTGSTYFLLGGNGGGTGSATVTGATISLAGTAGTTDAGLLVGYNGGSGTFTADSSTINISSQNDWAGLGAGFFNGVGGGSGEIVFQNGTTVNLTGFAAQITVADGNGLSGSLDVLSGSQISVTGTGADPWNETLIVGEQAGGAGGAVTIDGAGSLIGGLDIAVVGWNVFNGGATVGNGSLSIDHGGALSSDYVTIGRGGALTMGAGTVTLTNGGWFNLYEGAMRLLSTGVANFVGNVWFKPNSTVAFEIAADGSAAGMINHGGGTIGYDPGLAALIDPLGGYHFVAGQRYTLVQSTSLITYGTSTVTVNGQHADFGYAMVANIAGTQINFLALNNGDGTGSAIYDFGAGAATGASITYDSAIGNASFTGGQDARGRLYNIDGLLGTNLADTLTVAGSAGLSLDGRGGTDSLFGDGGVDTISGGADDDLIEGRANGDFLDGGVNGAAGDTLSYAGSVLGVTVNIGANTASGGDAAGDTISGFENIVGSAAADNLTGSSGDNTIEGGGSGDILAGGANGVGGDTVSYALSYAGVSVNLGANTAGGGAATGDVISGFENVTGSAFGDELTGSSGVNVLRGFGGDDQIEGFAGGDTLDGGANDANGDFLIYASSLLGVNVNLTTNVVYGGDARGDTVSNFENVSGSNQNDVIRGPPRSTR
ncbi:MAG: hypothetical protein IPL47_16640 [Phyllobacteriaceae bacterium]|nr:hypothetical protein [Phyllobacteriaceae bacterium]